MTRVGSNREIYQIRSIPDRDGVGGPRAEAEPSGHQLALTALCHPTNPEIGPAPPSLRGKPREGAQGGS